MTVEENIGLVPRLNKWPKPKIRERVLETLEVVRLPRSFLKRYPHELSGGQQQRVGVARAIGGEPDIVLMDEPLGALDPITREELQEEFVNLKAKIMKTIVFVTHDIFEAFKIGDRIAIMDAGEILQMGRPQEIAENPASEFVAKFLGRHTEALLLDLRSRDTDSGRE
jgi:osmoprotectant transport system ATP-binding protein